MNKDGAKCYFDGKRVEGNDRTTRCSPVTEEYRCFGCGAVICENHERGLGCYGQHRPEDHLKEASE